MQQLATRGSLLWISLMKMAEFLEDPLGFDLAALVLKEGARYSS